MTDGGAGPTPGNAVPTPAGRFNHLDAVRAAAMISVVTVHSLMSLALGFPWIVTDAERGLFGLVLMNGLSGFGQATFFMMAGFFTAMTWRRHGLRETLRRRRRTIVYPFLAALVTVLPATFAVMYHFLPAPGGPPATTSATAPPKDIWEAILREDTVALRTRRGTPLHRDVPTPFHPDYGMTPLALAAAVGDNDVMEVLLRAGADANGRDRDGSTPLFAAARFGRAGAFALLEREGAGLTARNRKGETAFEMLDIGWRRAFFDASWLGVSLTRNEFDAGRAEIGRLTGYRRQKGVRAWAAALPGLQHLWFLWFLVWLAVLFGLYGAVCDWLRPRGRGSSPRPPEGRFAGPLLLAGGVLLAMLFRHLAGQDLPLVPPTPPTAIVPDPAALGYYAVFFFFGVAHYDRPRAWERLGRGWRITIPLGVMVVLPLALELTTGTLGLVAGIGGFGFAGRALTVAAQVSYAWLLTTGLVGLFRDVMQNPSRGVRYISGSSYWLYLTHLPLVVLIQGLVAEWRMPAAAKFAVIMGVTLGLLLAAYHLAVRNTRVGTFLRGHRRVDAVAEERQ